ncbi:hypothetical protein M9Y10_033283 [Tritrichomonas musculus]|uniref:Vacuolar protein sorting-associated protein 13 DH-like domain-containing protein n=1 Tax=Tritrichomonas musculus TaxID=1915356 RepID=A0ABR2KCD5_9EUKA
MVKTTEIPFPFLRLILKSNSTNVSLKKAPSFFLLGFQIDIFNKNTQRWDLLVEPLEIYLSYTNTKNYNLEIKEKMNVVLSHAILNQICQFQFERQSIDHKNVLPSFLIENNTHDICEFIYNDKKDNMVIPPKCTTALRKLEPFKFMETVIDPLNFYSPQFISNKYSLSIFIKGKKRHVSINAPLLLKNKSDVNLFYQERHTGKVIELNKKSITPLFKLTAEFAIYGKNPAKTPNAINLFKLKEKKQLDIAVFVEDKIYHFYLSIKFTKKRGIVMLKIAPKFIIRNNHIFPIDFTVNDTQEIRIPPKSTEYMNQIDFDSSFNFFIEVGRYVSPTTKLNLKNNTHMAVYLGIDSAFSLRYDKEIDKGVFKEIITLQPPLLVKNQTDLPVTIFDHHNEPILTLKTKNSEDFFGPRDFLKDNKIRLSFQIEGYEKSDIFDTTIGRKEMFLKSLENNLYIPIALLISIGATGIIHLKIDHLIYIRNESTDAFYFQPDEAIKTKIKSLDINPSQTKPVLFCTPELDFIFSIDKIEQEIISINLQNTLENRNKFATLFINQYDMKIENQHILSVDFKTSSTLAGYLIEIKNCVFPQPLVLTNLLGEKNESQKGEIVVYYGSHSQKIVKPMSTSIISSRDLVGQKLKISCYNRKIKVNLTKFTEPTENILEMEDIKLTVFTKLVCLENGSHMIIVSNEIENKPNRFNLFSTHEISFGLTIPFISLNLIDDQMRELSLIGLQNTSIKCQFTKDTVECDLQIDLFQIDDMYPDTIVPVAVFNSSPPFISLKVIKENANMIFDLIELKMKPLTFYIDINYIAELFNFFTTIKKKERDETVEVKATSNRSSIPILIKKLFIDKIDIHASASSQTDRPKFHPFPYDFIIDVIPSVASIHIDRNQFTKSNLTSDNKVLNKMLKDYYNPLVNELKGLVAAHSISFAFVGLSNAIHKMNSQTKIDVAFNQEKGKVVQRGFQQFGKGLLNGVTGIIMKPVKGLKKDGAKGFFIGLGKGVGGIITDPLAGVIDASNGIVGEIKNALSESRDSMRFPRVFNNIQIQEYDDISAVCQLQYQRHIKNYNDCFVFFVKGEDKYIGITESFVALLVLNTQSKKPSKKYKVHNLRSIGDIESVNSFNKFLIIQFKDEFVIDIECQSNEIADIATKIIVSRSYYNNYSSNAASMTKMASTDFVIDDGEKRETKQVCVIADGFYSLKNSTGKYVTNDKEYMPLVANRGSAKGWEKFKITNNDDGTISFLSCKNNKFVSVGSKSKLFANATKIGQNEKFSVTKVDDKHFSFISMKTRQYVSADRNHFAHLYANRDVAKGWEKFELVPR